MGSADESRVQRDDGGELTFEQRLWLGALHAGPSALVGGLTAAAVHGLKRWDREEITVLVDDELSFEKVPGVDFFRTRRPLKDFRDRTDLPLCRIAPAVLLFAGYEPHPRTALGAVTAVVQQRLAAVSDLRHWLERMRPLRRAGDLRALFGDLEGGAHSLSERDLRQACRAFHIAMPRGQTPRLDRSGKRRFTDAEWDLADGRVLVLEVQGAHHEDAWQMADDLRRNRQLTAGDRIVVSCSALELRHEPGGVMADLIALGVPRAA